MGSATRHHVGLDIGTTKISCIIADGNGPEETRIVGIGNAPSEGLRRGVVVDLEKTVGSIARAVEEAERMAGMPAKGVYAGIAGDHIRSINSRGVIAVSRMTTKSHRLTSTAWSMRQRRSPFRWIAKSST